MAAGAQQAHLRCCRHSSHISGSPFSVFLAACSEFGIPCQMFRSKGSCSPTPPWATPIVHAIDCKETIASLARESTLGGAAWWAREMSKSTLLTKWLLCDTPAKGFASLEFGGNEQSLEPGPLYLNEHHPTDQSADPERQSLCISSSFLREVHFCLNWVTGSTCPST